MHLFWNSGDTCPGFQSRDVSPRLGALFIFTFCIEKCLLTMFVIFRINIMTTLQKQYLNRI